MGGVGGEDGGVGQIIMSFTFDNPEQSQLQILSRYDTFCTVCLYKTASCSISMIPQTLTEKPSSTPANYRPISLTAVCCKVMEHILHSQVMKHLDLHNILSDNQHGFRKD